MATYLMFGKYSTDALKKMSPKRTQEAEKLIQQSGGKVEAMYATLGQHDLVFVVDLPGPDEAFKVSVALGQATGIAFTTALAVPVEQFDKLLG
jgi:uncharacterized protein with GYD domain